MTAPGRGLPVASAREVRSQAGHLLRRHRRTLAVSLLLYALASLAGLAGPWLLGRLVDAVRAGTTTDRVDALGFTLVGAVAAQAALTFAARRTAFVLGETVFAELREEFIGRVLGLPLSTVERAGTGDLISRTTSDVDTLARTVRFAVPELLVATVALILTTGAALLVSPLTALALFIGVPAVWVGTRWYLHRAPAAYLRERAAYATLNGTISETADGARTVEALSIAKHRVRRADDDLTEAFRAERRTLYLRTVWFPIVEVAYVLPVATALLWGGWLVSQGFATAGQVTVIVLYAIQIVDPLDRMLMWLDEVQVGATSFARIAGVAGIPDDRRPTGATPQDERLVATGVRYAYRAGHDVLHGVDLSLQPGERLAVVGPSGAGKSTLGRLLAGIHGPRTGRVEIGDVRLVDLPLDRLRREVILVTQEHHIFVGTLRDNLTLAAPEAGDGELRRALAAVDALGWVDALPAGLDTMVGSGGHPLSPAQAQQVALARIVLADPHTLVLDEATSLLDPRAARHLERSLAAVLSGRTVIAIAHRLHTAHDADRVAVVEGGRLAEVGNHRELIELGGPYAALWESWHAAPTPTAGRGS